jgi:hypothetical protein
MRAAGRRKIMPVPKLTGAEFGGRLIALESVVMALAGEVSATLPPDRMQAAFAAAKAIAHEMVDQLAPDFSPAPPLVKDIEKFADGYVDVLIETIGKTAAKLKKDASAAAAPRVVPASAAAPATVPSPPAQPEKKS